MTMAKKIARQFAVQMKHLNENKSLVPVPASNKDEIKTSKIVWKAILADPKVVIKHIVRKGKKLAPNGELGVWDALIFTDGSCIRMFPYDISICNEDMLTKEAMQF